MRRPGFPWLLVVIAAAAIGLFIAMTALACANAFGPDPSGFHVAEELRAPWLDAAARVITTLGLIAVVGPVVLVGAGFLISSGHRARASALVAGAGLAWLSVWITKSLVDRARPPAALVATAGQSYPSAHAANSIGWLALAVATCVLMRRRRMQIAVVFAAALLAVVVGLSRIYLRAHYVSDVIGGEALGIAMFSLAALAVTVWRYPLRRTGRD